MMRLLVALFLLIALPAYAQQANPNNVNVPITQMQKGNPAQASDQLHIARCNYAGCDYSITAGSIAALVASGGYANELDVTSGMTATVTNTQTIVLFNSAAAGAKTVTIPASSGTRQLITIVDYFGNAGTYAITAVPVTGSIRGLSQVYGDTGSITLLDTSMGWVSI